MNQTPLTMEICETAHYIYSKGLAPGKSGNISARFHDIVAITPSGVSLGHVSEDEIVMVNMDGKILTGKNPSSELMLHLEVYKNKDVNGIVHTHSSYATGFAMSGKKIERLEGFGERNNPFLKMVDYAQPGTVKLAQLVGEGLKKEDVVILENHGVVATGENLSEAALLAEFVEETAKTQFVARVLSNMEF
ncbi:class II aldolase/adducin family protein [uncultured Methanobacterium sp.]|uniref:class II aldolase/adducin family protein n=1 Tax=uncultured Methanobacterium sp. TaxID=176306 RepID=UPI002AA78E3D|nr:class II aldolase/adducin family protein [uncultured Methanobacterium sp.]